MNPSTPLSLHDERHSAGRTHGDARLRAVAPFIMFGLALTLVFGVTLFATQRSDTLELKAGQIADRTIKAPSTATFVSELKTAEQRQEAYDDSRNIVLRSDPSVAPAQAALLRDAIREIDAIRGDAATPSATADAERIRAAVEGLSQRDAEGIAGLSDETWSRVKAEAQRLLAAVMAQEIRPEDIAAVKEGLNDQASTALSVQERALSAALARPFVQANISIDDGQTTAARKAAAANVEPVLVTVQQGQVIVRDGDPVTAYDIEKLDYFGLLTPPDTWQHLAGTLGLLAFLVTGLAFYLYRVARGAWESRQLVLIGSVIGVTVVAGRFLLQVPDLRPMFPAAAAIMLLAVLLDFHVAVVLAAFLALGLGIVAGMSLEVAFAVFLAGLAGAALIWRAERAMTFLWAGLAVAGTTFASVVLFSLVSGELNGMAAMRGLVAAGINGAVSASLTFLSFSLLGRVFGITTHLQLLELAHPNQPLLYRLAREAPGTYHHSIVVSNLAESAVEEVGGDPLFTRVAVLYHDIGKVLRPGFFVENQANRANVHEALDPRTSARIIQEHVADGVRLARKARLPQSIIDVIQQHHGTTLVKYFYTQAVNAGEDVDEAEFRYPGPRPQTKEAGVIMLADGVEAAVRAASQSGKLYEDVPAEDGVAAHRTAQLHRIVDDVIRSRLEDGQLDECDLTLKDIERVRQTFVTILEGIYHPRIEYPELRRAPTPPPATPDVTPVEAR